ncbi:translation initiation factor IF-2-like [Chelonia mydas]|uniref:translation initiation factor IF-2-like n=1 Tax=Chelonia mydas TaxID=8469 RepID=UPI001CA9C758|nr:translation initiation factor IF-2-like [Chelonia mydas]
MLPSELELGLGPGSPHPKAGPGPGESGFPILPAAGRSQQSPAGTGWPQTPRASRGLRGNRGTRAHPPGPLTSAARPARLPARPAHVGRNKYWQLREPALHQRAGRKARHFRPSRSRPSPRAGALPPRAAQAGSGCCHGSGVAGGPAGRALPLAGGDRSDRARGSRRAAPAQGDPSSPSPAAPGLGRLPALRLVWPARPSPAGRAAGDSAVGLALAELAAAALLLWPGTADREAPDQRTLWTRTNRLCIGRSAELPLLGGPLWAQTEVGCPTYFVSLGAQASRSGCTHLGENTGGQKAPSGLENWLKARC